MRKNIFFTVQVVAGTAKTALRKVIFLPICMFAAKVSHVAIFNVNNVNNNQIIFPSKKIPFSSRVIARFVPLIFTCFFPNILLLKFARFFGW